MTKPYYITTPINQQQLKLAVKKNISKEKEILDIFENGGLYSAWDLQKMCPHMIITSIRRCLTNLEKRGKVQRLNFKPDRFGKPCGVYKITTL